MQETEPVTKVKVTNDGKDRQGLQMEHLGREAVRGWGQGAESGAHLKVRGSRGTHPIFLLTNIYNSYHLLRSY